jgi:Flp pilus assembly protein TadD
MSSRSSVVYLAVVCCLLATVASAQVSLQHGPRTSSPDSQSSATASVTAASELRTGTDLTRQGMLQKAIPHLLAAKREGLAPYAVGVNLGICYLGTGDYKQAIAELESLRASGHKSTIIDNLLAQAYIGDGQTGPAFQVFLEASAAAPEDEKLYAYMADACTDHQDYKLGLRMVDEGLKHLPNSARLHYERAVFLSRLDRFDEAKSDFNRAAQLANGDYIGTLALVQKDLYEDDLKGAATLLRQAVKDGHRDYQTLELLGSVLLVEGAVPGQPEFAEAQSALEESAKQQPRYSTTQIALGKLYLREGRYKDAAEHLEIGRRLEPNNPAVYTSLATAYSGLGERDKAREMSRQVGRLLAERKSPAPLE